ncbi:MAG: hypothetical protein PUD24_02655 [Oscillospiraceae bacterium]|nr:hypothetical protein [Oscillospiraceae bacterium]
MGYVYAGLWAVLAIYLFVMANRVSKILYLVGGLFSFMAIWWLVNELVSINLFEGVYGIIFRVAVGVILIALLIIYLIMKKRNNQE